LWEQGLVLHRAQNSRLDPGFRDAVSREVIDSRYTGHLTGHSLGTARANNLYSQGHISGATTLSLPVFAYAAKGSTSYCANTDPICGGGLLTPLRAGVQSLAGPDNILESHDWNYYRAAIKR
jgi:hypothetical protein